MNRTLVFLFFILALLPSCSNDENKDGSQTNSSNDKVRWYGVKTVKDEISTRGVAQRDKLWSTGTTITVKFLNDPYNMAEKVKTYAKEWEEYANIKFEFVNSSEKTNIRIGFDWNDSKWVTWSYTGTDAKYIKDQGQATVNFAFWDSASEIEKKADVLRIFGQVLGLELEHRHLKFDASWTSRIQDYWEGEIEDIPWDELKEYVFDPIETRNLVQTEQYDENSIMIWPFNRKYASNTARDYNYELSENDKTFIAQLYPKNIILDVSVELTYNLAAGSGVEVNNNLYVSNLSGLYRLNSDGSYDLICKFTVVYTSIPELFKINNNIYFSAYINNEEGVYYLDTSTNSVKKTNIISTNSDVKSLATVSTIQSKENIYFFTKYGIYKLTSPDTFTEMAYKYYDGTSYKPDMKLSVRSVTTDTNGRIYISAFVSNGPNGYLNKLHLMYIDENEILKRIYTPGELSSSMLRLVQFGGTMYAYGHNNFGEMSHDYSFEFFSNFPTLDVIEWNNDLYLSSNSTYYEIYKFNSLNKTFEEFALIPEDREGKVLYMKAVSKGIITRTRKVIYLIDETKKHLLLSDVPEGIIFGQAAFTDVVEMKNGKIYLLCETGVWLLKF